MHRGRNLIRKARIILILSVCLILTLSSTATEDTSVVDESLKVTPTMNFQKSWETHGRIEILNDTHFDDVAAAEGWAGGGNSTHPYIIENYDVSSDNINIRIWTTSRHFIIRNCYLQPNLSPFSNFGVYLYLTPNAVIENVTVFQKMVGFYMYDTDNIIVTESKADSCDNGFFMLYSNNVDFSEIEATDCSINGVYLFESDFASIDTASVSGPGERGIQILDCNDATLSNAEIHDFTYEGLLLNGSTNCHLNGNTAYTCGDNMHSGIHCFASDDITVTNMTSWEIAQGFTVTDSQRFTMEDSYLHDNWQGGIAFWQCTDVVVRRTPVESHMYMGIGLYDTNTSLIEYCDISYNSWEGVYLSNSQDSKIAHNILGNDGSSFGYHEIYAINSDSLTIFNNSISWNQNANGIRLETSDYANITGNEIFYNTEYGVLIEDSSHCTMDNNTIYGNGNDGIVLNVAHFSTLTEQIIHDNGHGGIYVADANDTVIERSKIYSHPDYGIYMETSHRVEIRYCDVSDSGADGLYMHYSDECTISYCNFWENAGADCEITLFHSSHATILENNLIGNLASHGMYLTFSHHVNIIGNTITGNTYDGLNIQNSNYTHIANNTISYNGDSGVYLWESDFFTLIENTIDGNDMMGAYISYCLNGTLSNNEISQNRYEGVYCTYSPNLVLESNYIFDNGWVDIFNPRSGVYIGDSDNCQLVLNVIYNNTVHGIDLRYSDDCLLDSNTIYGNLGMSSPGCGVYLYYADGAIIKNNVIHHNVDDGIYGLYTNNCEILGNIIYSNQEFGIEVAFASFWIISDNEVWNQTTALGIHLMHCISFVIDSNELYGNVMGGIRLYLTEDTNFTSNFVHHNYVVGVQVDYCEGDLLYGNIISDNYQYGLYMLFSGNCSIYYNDFVLNTMRDCLEINATAPNYWDDGVSMGNWYWGISRTLDNYTIYDMWDDPYNVDNYPMTSIWIDDATSTGYEIISTGNTVNWSAYAHNPDYYELYDGGLLFRTGSWIGLDFIVNIDGLSVGITNLEMRIYHVVGHYLTATVQVNVSDTTSPTWVVEPRDQEIEYGHLFSYQVNATDASGIHLWSLNDTVHFSITDGLIQNVTVLDVGSYGLMIFVEDPYGNSLNISITITVTEVVVPTSTTTTTTAITTITTTSEVITSTTPTTSSTPPDGTMIIIIVGVGGAVVVIIIIVVVSKKRGS